MSEKEYIMLKSRAFVMALIVVVTAVFAVGVAKQATQMAETMKHHTQVAYP